MSLPVPHVAAAPPGQSSNSGLFDRDRFLLLQKHLALSETYRVFDEQGQPIMFVKREGRHLRQLAAAVAAVTEALPALGVAEAVRETVEAGRAAGRCRRIALGGARRRRRLELAAKPLVLRTVGRAARGSEDNRHENDCPHGRRY